MTNAHGTAAGEHPDFQIVAVVASAGGVGALQELLGKLPGDFALPVAVVQHIDPDHPSMLADILDRATDLEVTEARDGQQIRPGVVYIAPPDRHLMVDRSGGLSLATTEKIHFLRPSGDMLFQSIADSCGASAVAVVLTGTGSDGAQGVAAVSAAGGTVIAQDEASSAYFDMPSAAINTGCVNQVLDLGDIPGALVSLVDGERTAT